MDEHEQKTTEAESPATEEHEEYQYLNLIRHVIQHGQHRPDRTGTGTESTLPLITTKKVHTKSIIHELLWFIKGSTSAKELSSVGVKIWEANGSRAYLDSVGLGDYEEGSLGPIYGFQWRHFGATYHGPDHSYHGQGVDQLQQIIDTIKNNPTDRRMILTAWNPAAIPQMALPPCHMMCQFYVTLPDADHPKPRLSGILYQRSADIGLGLPFNIASYAMLIHMLGWVTHTEPFELVVQLGDAHVYNNHLEPLAHIQLLRRPLPFPKLVFQRPVEHIDDFRFDDFVIRDYSSHPKIQMDMSV